MRFSLLIFGFLFFFCAVFPVQAQDLASDLSSETSAGDDPSHSDTQQSDKSNKVSSAKDRESKADTSGGVDIGKATDKQIDEAQRFYKACKNNEELSAEHDCRCLAGEFLVARMKRGDDASYKRVFADVRSLCLVDPKAKKNLGNQDSAGLGDEYTEAQVKEAQGVYLWCKNDSFMPIYYDCKCMAGEFIEKRREMGRIPNRDHVLSKLKGTCLNSTEMAGYLYSDCIKKPGQLPLRTKDPKKFCECYANEFAKGFSTLEGTDVSMNATSALAGMAMNKCQNEQRTFTLN